MGEAFTRHSLHPLVLQRVKTAELGLIVPRECDVVFAALAQHAPRNDDVEMIVRLTLMFRRSNMATAGNNHTIDQG